MYLKYDKKYFYINSYKIILLKINKNYIKKYIIYFDLNKKLLNFLLF